jgi:transcriptional repressor NrdR
MVVKKDGRREPFDPDKLRSGVVKACEKRPIPMQKLDELVADIQTRVESDYDREVTSAQLGDMVMDRLQEIDEVAYVRFAAVYRHFKDIQTFMEELSKLLTRKT